MYVCMYVCTYVCTYVRRYVCIYTYIYIYIYIYVHTRHFILEGVASVAEGRHELSLGGSSRQVRALRLMHSDPGRQHLPGRLRETDAAAARRACQPWEVEQTKHEPKGKGGASGTAFELCRENRYEFLRSVNQKERKSSWKTLKS